MGSGIQGICCAIALANAGYDVTILEQDREILSRTTKNNEGRAHLGFTYSLDESHETGKLCLYSGLTFSKILEEWLGPIDWSKMLLEKGYYAISRSTLYPEDKIISYFEHLQTYYDNLISENKNYSYFGEKPKKIFNVLNKLPSFASSKKISSVIETEERIIEMIYFRNLLSKKLKSSKVKIITSCKVLNVIKENNGFSVITKNAKNEERNFRSNILINCLWNNRIAIDKKLGHETVKDPMYRFKFGILGKIADKIPNCSIISGAFGNVSPRLDGTFAYASWHPECMRDLNLGGVTPISWEDSFKDSNLKNIEQKWIEKSINKLTEFFPSMKSFKPTRLLPGIICSSGKTDIDDVKSEVHNRSTSAGIYSFGNYHSIDTGKFTSAPFFAKKILEKIKNNFE
jgi:hypothetical protein